MSKVDLHSSLAYERDRKLRELQEEADSVNILTYVKFSFYVGIIFAIGTFLYVGSWYDKQYGFNGSAGVAILAAIGVLIIFAIIGALIGNSVKNSYLREIDRVNAHYDKMVKTVETTLKEAEAKLLREATALHSKFANNEHIQVIIANATKDFVDDIQRMPRPTNRKELNLSACILVSKSRILYNFNEVLDFGPEGRTRLQELSSAAERQAAAQVIADNVAVQIKTLFPKDPSGNTPVVTVTCGDDIHSETKAFVTYSCTNGFYEEVISW